MSPVSKSMLEKYLRGECSAEEEAHVRHWFDLNDADQYPQAMRQREYARRGKKLWQRLRGGLRQDGMVSTEEPADRFRRLLPYAAAVLLLAGAFIIWQQRGANSWWNSVSYSVGAGEIRRVSLPDGTEVVLNSTSEIRIRNDYGEENRSVYLEGEAYFLVADDSLRAFIVYSNNIATTALGTAFNVSAYPNDGETVVSLHEGSVSVNRTKEGNGWQQLVLEPGEEAVCPGKGEITRQVFNPMERLDWKDQVIYFEQAALTEVIQKLERYYGVRFDYSELDGERWELTGEYHQVPLKAILESLSFNYGIKYELKDNKVTLYK